MQSFIVERPLNSVRVFWLKSDELIGELRKKADELGKKDRRILKIVLFGSLAEGKAVPGSDADILIILKEHDKPFIERIHEYMSAFDINFPVEVFPYLADEKTAIVDEALKKGMTLFER